MSSEMASAAFGNASDVGLCVKDTEGNTCCSNYWTWARVVRSSGLRYRRCKQWEDWQGCQTRTDWLVLASIDWVSQNGIYATHRLGNDGSIHLVVTVSTQKIVWKLEWNCLEILTWTFKASSFEGSVSAHQACTNNTKHNLAYRQKNGCQVGPHES